MFVVVKIQSWDHEVKSQVFPTDETAIEALQKDWENTFNDWLDPYDDCYIPEETYHEEEYAVISFEAGTKIEWFLTSPDTISPY